MDILKLQSELILKDQNKKTLFVFLMFWLPAFLIFIVGNTSIDWYTNIINIALIDYSQYLPSKITNVIAEKGDDFVVNEVINRIVIPARESIYFFSLIILVLPVLRSIRDSYITLINRQILYRALRINLYLTALALSFSVSGLTIASLNPFGQSTGWFYRRIFSVALAYFTHLNGYVLFIVFSFIIMYCVICSVILLLEQRNIHLSDFQYTSILSSGLIIYFFPWPGSRPEYIIFLFAVLSLLLPLSKYGRAALVVLMLSTHEAAALCIALPLILFVFPKNERYINFAVIIMYFSLWLLNFNFNLKAAIETQALIGNEFAYEGAVKTPLNIIGGIFFSYKMLWCFVPIALYYFIRNKEFNSIYKVLFAVLFPILQIIIAYDTSRLIAFGYLGILCSVIYSYQYMPRNIFNLILLINILIPSYDVGLWGFHLPEFGLYKVFDLL